jgi:hypothetical protein
LTFDWTFAPDPTTLSTTYYNNGVGPDPYPSPGGTFPFSASDTASVNFAAPGVYTITVTVTDDDGGFDSVEFTKIVTDDMEEARTQGFWRRQFADKKKQHIQDEALMAYLDIANFASRVFSEEVPLTSFEEARDVFAPGGPDAGDPHPSNMKGKATQQSLAAWLNFASGAILWDELVPTEPEDSFSNAIMAVEDILLDLDGDDDHEDYVLANDIATAMNEMDE